MQVRLQLQQGAARAGGDVYYHSMLHGLQRVAREEGAYWLWRPGVEATWLRAFSSTDLRIGLYDSVSVAGTRREHAHSPRSQGAIRSQLSVAKRPARQWPAYALGTRHTKAHSPLPRTRKRRPLTHFCDQLTGRVKIFQQDFKAGKLVLESCNLRLAQAGCTQGAVYIVGVCVCAFVCMLLSRRGREEFDDEIGMRILPVALMSSFSALSSLSPQALIRRRHGGFSL